MLFALGYSWVGIGRCKKKPWLAPPIVKLRNKGTVADGIISSF